MRHLRKFNLEKINESIETKLEVGSIVYDNALYGRGKVANIKKTMLIYPIGETVNPNPIIVHFGQIVVKYTIDGRINKDQNPTLSMEEYDRISDIVPVFKSSI